MRQSIGLRHTATAAAVLAVMVASACSSSGGGATSNQSNGSAVKAVNVSDTIVTGSLLSLPQYVAADQGFYTANGLDVSSVPVTNGPASTAAMLSGSAQISFNNADGVLTANDKGQSLKVICGVVHGSWALIARNSWPLPHAGSYPAEMADLKGAKIGVTAIGSPLEIWTKQMLTEGGLNPNKDVTFIAVGVGATALSALQAGQIDALTSIEPGTTTAISQLKIAKFVVNQVAGQGPSNLVNMVSNLFASTDQFIQDHGDTVKRYVAAITDAVAWIQNPANRSALEAIVAKNIKVDAALIPQLLDANLKTFNVSVPQADIENSISVDKAAGLIKGSPTYDSVVATQYAPTS